MKAQIRQLNKIRKMMHEQNGNINRDSNYEEEPKRNSETEE